MATPPSPPQTTSCCDLKILKIVSTPPQPLERFIEVIQTATDISPSRFNPRLNAIEFPTTTEAQTVFTARSRISLSGVDVWVSFLTPSKRKPQRLLLCTGVNPSVSEPQLITTFFTYGFIIDLLQTVSRDKLAVWYTQKPHVHKALAACAAIKREIGGHNFQMVQASRLPTQEIDQFLQQMRQPPQDPQPSTPPCSPPPKASTPAPSSQPKKVARSKKCPFNVFLYNVDPNTNRFELLFYLNRFGTIDNMTHNKQSTKPNGSTFLFLFRRAQCASLAYKCCNHKIPYAADGQVVSMKAQSFEYPAAMLDPETTVIVSPFRPMSDCFQIRHEIRLWGGVTRITYHQLNNNRAWVVRCSSKPTAHKLEKRIQRLSRNLKEHFVVTTTETPPAMFEGEGVVYPTVVLSNVVFDVKISTIFVALAGYGTVVDFIWRDETTAEVLFLEEESVYALVSDGSFPYGVARLLVNEQNTD